MFGFERRNGIHSTPIDEITSTNTPEIRRLYTHEHVIFPRLDGGGALDIVEFRNQFRSAAIDYKEGDIVCLTIHDSTNAVSRREDSETAWELAAQILREKNVVPLYAVEVSLGVPLPGDEHQQGGSWYGTSKKARRFNGETFHAQVISYDLENLKPLIEHAQSEQFRMYPWLHLTDFLQLVNQEQVLVTANHLDHNSPVARERIIEISHDLGWLVEIADNWLIAKILGSLGVPLPPAEQKRVAVDFPGVNVFDLWIQGVVSGSDSHMFKKEGFYRDITTYVEFQEADVTTPEGFQGLKQALLEGKMWIENGVPDRLRQKGWNGTVRDLMKEQKDRELVNNILNIFNPAYESREGRIWGSILNLKQNKEILGLFPALLQILQDEGDYEMLYDAKAAVANLGLLGAFEFMQRMTHARPGQRIPLDAIGAERVKHVVAIGGFLNDPESDFPFRVSLERLGIQTHYISFDELLKVAQDELIKLGSGTRRHTQTDIFTLIAPKLEEEIRKLVGNEAYILAGHSSGAIAALVRDENDPPERTVLCAAPMSGALEPDKLKRFGLRLNNRAPLSVRRTALGTGWEFLNRTRLAQRHNIDRMYFSVEESQVLVAFYKSLLRGEKEWRKALDEHASKRHPIVLALHDGDHALLRLGAMETYAGLVNNPLNGVWVQFYPGNGHEPPDPTELLKLMLYNPDHLRINEMQIQHRDALVERIRISDETNGARLILNFASRFVHGKEAVPA